jgi:hypothetical protein
MKPYRAMVECLTLRDTAGRSVTSATVLMASRVRFIYTPRP